MLILNLYNTKNTTILKSTKIFIPFRAVQGGIKKVGEELTKKCIGAGCSSTRPLWPENKEPTVNVKENKPTNNNSVMQSGNTAQENSTNSSVTITLPCKKEMSKPINPIKDKVKEKMQASVDNKEDTRFIEKQETSNIKKAIGKPLEVRDNIRMHPKDPMKAFTDFSLNSHDPIKKTDLAVNQKQDIEEQSGPEDPLIAIRLKSNVSGDTKHVNVGEFNEKGTSVITYGALTSSNDFDFTGKPTTYKVSNVKMDGSFIKEPFVQKVEKKTDNEPDYIAGFAVSQNTSGQRIRIFKEPIEYSSKEYEVSSMGMAFYENNFDAEQKTIALIMSKKKNIETKHENKDTNNLDENV